MSQSATLDVTEFINSNKVSGFQLMTVFLCFLIVAIDGFDTASIGFLAPAIRQEWGLTPADLAPLFGAGLFGLMAGAFLFGPLADRFGRKAVLLFSVAFFGIACLASAYSTSLGMLVVLRFLTGLGLGGAMPNSITMTSEYCPERHRLFMVTTMFCGFTIGSALGGLASAHLVERYGWRSVLELGGALPLILLPILAWKLPESVRYLVLKNSPRDKIARILKRIAPQMQVAADKYVLAHRSTISSPVRHLFSKDLIVGTLLLWATFFMSLLIIYLLSSWLPTLLRTTGMDLKTASLVTTMFQVGGTIGAILLGYAMDRMNPHYVLAVCYAVATICIAAIGMLAHSIWPLGFMVFLAGFTISGGQVGANALAASFYPTDCRATGVSWSNAVGRIGSVLGSMSGAAMMAMGLPMSQLFMIVGLPALVAAVTIFTMGRYRARQSHA